jgi:hypothetical protein
MLGRMPASLIAKLANIKPTTINIARREGRTMRMTSMKQLFLVLNEDATLGVPLRLISITSRGDVKFVKHFVQNSIHAATNGNVSKEAVALV